MPDEELEETYKEFSRPEYLRRSYYLAAAFLVLVVISILPTPSGLSVEGQRALGVLGFVTVLWVTEAFPLGLTALFGTILLPLLGIVSPNNSFTGFMNPALFFLIGGISFGIAMQKTNLHKRVALKFIRRFGRSSTSIILSICFLGGFMAFTMPEHAVAALLLPVLMGIVDAGDVEEGENFGIAIFLALTYSTSVGSIGTLLGGARNVLAIGILEESAGVSLSFLEWVIAGAPIAVVLMFLTFIVLRFVYPWKEVETQKIRKQMEKEVSEMGPMSTDEKKAATIFGIAFVLWMTVGTEIGLATVAIGGLILLVITRTLTWRDIERNMPWGLLFLYGGALTLSSTMSRSGVGSVDFIAGNLLGFIGQHPYLIIVGLLLLVLLVSNLMSNSAATAVILPISIQALMTLGYSSRLPAYLIAMGSAMAFMLPIATPSAAIAYSSGHIRIRNLVKAGAVLSLVSIGTFLTVGIGWWKLIGVW